MGKAYASSLVTITSATQPSCGLWSGQARLPKSISAIAGRSFKGALSAQVITNLKTTLHSLWRKWDLELMTALRKEGQARARYFIAFKAAIPQGPVDR
jgi:hypothetical protein